MQFLEIPTQKPPSALFSRTPPTTPKLNAAALRLNLAPYGTGVPGRRVRFRCTNVPHKAFGFLKGVDFTVGQKIAKKELIASCIHP